MLTEYATPEALAAALASYVAAAITSRLEKSPNCAIALSGGKPR